MKTDTPNIRVQYREALERLHAAEDEAAAVKARYERVLVDVNAKRTAIKGEVAQLADALDRAIEIANQTPTADPKTAPRTTTAAPQSSSQDEGNQADAPPYLRDVILAIPRDGAIGFKELMAEMDIGRPTLNTRLAKGKSKKWGMVESAGHGRYQLTDLGKLVHTRYALAALQLVPSSTSEAEK